MQVTPKVSCVTRVGGIPISLTRGVAADLPTEVAERLVKAGHCARTGRQAPQAQQESKPEPSKAPAKEIAAKKAPAKPRPRGKSAGPAPENKGA